MVFRYKNVECMSDRGFDGEAGWGYVTCAGFAYGGLPGFAVADLEVGGRGFANQQVIEELQARRDLRRKVGTSQTLNPS